MEKYTQESYLAFAKRATEALQDGLIDYEEWGEAVLGENIYSQENTRRCAKFFSQFIQNLENDTVEQIDDKDKVAEIKKAMAELKSERIKIQTANLEYNANARAEARGELFQERIAEAINRLEPVKVKHIELSPVENNIGLLCLSDFHAGSTYEVKGLYGEVVNRYDFGIMKDRLWRLIGMIEADDIVIDKLIVANLGDFFENILRMSSLTKLREPVVDTVIKFSEFMACWLIELHDRLNVPIEVVTVGGNHDISRILGQQPQLEEENLGKIVVEFLKLRLAQCVDIQVDDYTDVAVKTIGPVNVMFTHGEDKDLVTTIEYFSNLYNVDADEIFAGHFHRPESKTIGITDLGDRMIYRVGSICGCDTYSKRLRKSARPSAYFALYEKDQGHTWSKNYYL